MTPLAIAWGEGRKNGGGAGVSGCLARAGGGEGEGSWWGGGESRGKTAKIVLNIGE